MNNFRYIAADPGLPPNTNPVTYTNLLFEDDFDGVTMRYACYSMFVKYNGMLFASLDTLDTKGKAAITPIAGSAGTNGYWQVKDYETDIAYAKNTFVLDTATHWMYRMTSAISDTENKGIEALKLHATVYGYLAGSTKDIVPNTIVIDGQEYKVWLMNYDYHRGYGNNLWIWSSYRMNANSTVGSSDREKDHLQNLNAFDVRSSSGLAACNSPTLKMSTEPEICKHIIPCAVSTRVASLNWGRAIKWYHDPNDSSIKMTMTMDRFYPITIYEVERGTESS